MRVAILGSGKIGATLARRFTQTGHEVTTANSRGPGSLAPLLAELGPDAHAAVDVAAAAASGDVSRQLGGDDRPPGHRERLLLFVAGDGAA